MLKNRYGLLLEKLFTCPVLVTFFPLGVSHCGASREHRYKGKKNILSIRHVPSHNQRNFLLAQLFDGDLQGVRLALEVDQDGRVHADLERACAQDPRLLVLGHEGRRGALVVGYLLVLVRLLVALAMVGRRIGVARRDDMVVLAAVVAGAVLPAAFLVGVCRFGLGLVVLIGVFLVGELLAVEKIRG